MTDDSVLVKLFHAENIEYLLKALARKKDTEELELQDAVDLLSTGIILAGEAEVSQEDILELLNGIVTRVYSKLSGKESS